MSDLFDSFAKGYGLIENSQMNDLRKRQIEQEMLANDPNTLRAINEQKLQQLQYENGPQARSVAEEQRMSQSMQARSQAMFQQQRVMELARKGEMHQRYASKVDEWMQNPDAPMTPQMLAMSAVVLDPQIVGGMQKQFESDKLRQNQNTAKNLSGFLSVLDTKDESKINAWTEERLAAAVEGGDKDTAKQMLEMQKQIKSMGPDAVRKQTASLWAATDPESFKAYYKANYDSERLGIDQQNADIRSREADIREGVAEYNQNVATSATLMKDTNQANDSYIAASQQAAKMATLLRDLDNMPNGSGVATDWMETFKKTTGLQGEVSSARGYFANAMADIKTNRLGQIKGAPSNAEGEMINGKMPDQTEDKMKWRYVVAAEKLKAEVQAQDNKIRYEWMAANRGKTTNAEKDIKVMGYSVPAGLGFNEFRERFYKKNPLDLSIFNPGQIAGVESNGASKPVAADPSDPYARFRKK